MGQNIMKEFNPTDMEFRRYAMMHGWNGIDAMETFYGTIKVQLPELTKLLKHFIGLPTGCEHEYRYPSGYRSRDCSKDPVQSWKCTKCGIGSMYGIL